MLFLVRLENARNLAWKLAFVLRGITLRGIDSAWCPSPRRREIWDLLASTWKLDPLDAIREEIGFDQLADKVEQILAGNNVGRTVVNVKQ